LSLVKLICVIAIVGVLSGCKLKLAYDYADWWVAWQVGDYVSLTSKQDKQLDKMIDEFFIWHRQNELPKYIERLDLLSEMIEKDDYSGFESWYDKNRELWLPPVNYLLEQLLPLSSQLSDKQKNELVDNISRKQQEKHREWLEEFSKPDNEVEEDIEELEEWLGYVTPEQKQSIVDFISQSPNLLAARIESRELWLQKFKSALLQIPVEKTKLTVLVTDPSSYRSSEFQSAMDEVSVSRRIWMKSMLQSLESEQAKNVLKKLQTYRSDLSDLVNETDQ
jgi:hypothetical protein